MINLVITDHALKRYNQRIGNATPEQVLNHALPEFIMDGNVQSLLSGTFRVKHNGNYFIWKFAQNGKLVLVTVY